MKIDLAAAIAAGELEVWYQPQVAASSGRVVGVEALARWNHPQKGRLSPDVFVETGEAFIAELSAFVLPRACADAARWRGVAVGVNVSARQFADEAFADWVAAAAAAAGLPLDRLELEILEGTAFHDPAAARPVMARLRGMGVRIAIDDFGHGHSAQSLELDLPVSKIKLAQSIVADRSARVWLADFVREAHGRGMEVTAEGVETEELAAAMREAGCDLLQGYHFGRPAPASHLDAQLRGAP